MRMHNDPEQELRRRAAANVACCDAATARPAGSAALEGQAGPEFFIRRLRRAIRLARKASPGSAAVGVGVGVDIGVISDTPQHAADGVGREPSGHQEPLLPGALGRISRRAAETPAPQLAGALQLRRGHVPQGLVDDGVIDPAGPQVHRQTPRAVAGGPGVNHRFRGACIVEQTLALEVVEQGLDLLTVGTAVARLGESRLARELARQLDAGVFAPRQVAQRAGLEREFGYSLAPPSATASGTPMASRTLFSISRASSGFSRRNSRALSLPWPIFSPL